MISWHHIKVWKKFHLQDYCVQTGQVSRWGGTCHIVLQGQVEEETFSFYLRNYLIFWSDDIELLSRTISRWVENWTSTFGLEPYPYTEFRINQVDNTLNCRIQCVITTNEWPNKIAEMETLFNVVTKNTNFVH